jgi:Tfp pilus assembly protein PilN
MRALQLDYRDNNDLRNFFGLLLLALVLLLALAIGWYFSSVRQQASQLQASVDTISSQINGPTETEVNNLPPQKLAEVMKFSNHTIHQLNLPWNILFIQLEKAKSDGVALLGVEPNTNSSVIKVVGEAKDYASMLKYVRSLSEQGVLHGVYLIDHKMDDQNPDRPIRFSLEASWASK